MPDDVKQKLTTVSPLAAPVAKPTPTPTPTPTPAAAAAAAPKKKLNTLRSQLLDTFKQSGEIGLSAFEKGKVGVRFYLGPDGTPVAESTKDTNVFELDGKKYQRADILKVLDIEQE
jgi:hypothetical protein